MVKSVWLDESSSGIGQTRPTAVAPGSVRKRSSSRRVRCSAASGADRVAGMITDRTAVGVRPKPGSTVSVCCQLRKKRPAPTSSTSDMAIWATTITLRHLRGPGASLPLLPAFSAEPRSARVP